MLHRVLLVLSVLKLGLLWSVEGESIANVVKQRVRGHFDLRSTYIFNLDFLFHVGVFWDA